MSHVIPLPPCARRRGRGAGAEAHSGTANRAATSTVADGAKRADRLAALAEDVHHRLSRRASGTDVLPELAQLIDGLGELHCLLDEAAHQAVLR